MRFSVATIAVLQASLPAATIFAHSVRNANVEEQVSATHLFSDRSLLRDEPEEHYSPPTHKSASPLSGRGFGRGSPKKAFMMEGIECDPDVGRLACGVGTYCARNETSTLGGSCTAFSLLNHHPDDEGNRHLHRHLEGKYDFWLADMCCHDDTPEDAKEGCDCNHWNSHSQTGSWTYQSETEYCQDDCEDLCLNYSIAYQTDGTSYQYTFCYHFTSPYAQTLCFGADSSTGHCEIALNGAYCTYCQHNAATYCTYFDCDSIGLDSGNTCEDVSFSPPILETCVTPGVCSFCESGMDYPYAVVDVLGYGSVTCLYMKNSIAAGVSSSDENRCDYLKSLAWSSCCPDEDDGSVTVPSGPTESPTASPTKKSTADDKTDDDNLSDGENNSGIQSPFLLWTTSYVSLTLTTLLTVLTIGGL